MQAATAPNQAGTADMVGTNWRHISKSDLALQSLQYASLEVQLTKCHFSAFPCCSPYSQSKGAGMRRKGSWERESLARVGLQSWGK